MLVRIFIGVFSAAMIVLASGCVGPIKDRLYVSEWKSKKQRPIEISKSSEYKGEHWERFVWVDSKP